MVERVKQKLDATESPQRQASGISTLRKPKGAPNQAKSHPGVSGRPLGPPRKQPPPPPGGARRIENQGLPSPARASGGSSAEEPINTRARVRGQQADQEVPPSKVSGPAEEAKDGLAGRTKKDDVVLGRTRTPPPPPPPAAAKSEGGGKDGKGQPKPLAAAPVDPILEEMDKRDISALETGAPIDPETGQPQKPDFDGDFTDEEGKALNTDGTNVTDTDTGAPLTPEQSLTATKQAERGDTSPFVAEKEAKAEKDLLRRKQPSEIEGITQGHFESIVNDTDAAQMRSLSGGPLPKIKQAEWKESARKQLSEFGTWPGSEDPDAPSPPIRPMGRSFNPFSGKFTGENGPSFQGVKGFDFKTSTREFFKQGGKAELPPPDQT